MRAVRVTTVVPGAVADAERHWYDTSHWPSWVEGLDQVVALEGDWPGAGARVTWTSGPAGRGRVTERVIAYQPVAGQTLEVEDGSIRGRQSVAFAIRPGGVQVVLTLEYELKRRSLISPIVDALFIKRAMAASLNVTLTRFGAHLQAAAERRGFSPCDVAAADDPWD